MQVFQMRQYPRLWINGKNLAPLIDQKLESGSLGCTRLMSHMYYMILRTRKGEGTNADFNEFIFQNYPRTGEAAKRVCDYMSRQLKQPVAKEEIGFLAIHIQRVISPDTV